VKRLHNVGGMGAAAFRRPDKPLYAVKPCTKSIEAELTLDCGPKIEIVTVDKSTECHVTPSDVAQRMVEYVAWDFYTHESYVLEPSFGTGQILRELLKHDWAKVVGVELNIQLASRVQHTPDFSYVEKHQMDFLDYQPDIEFTCICMNPPFTPVVKHMQHAYDLLVEGGIMIALVPTSYNEAKLKGDFSFTELEVLPNDTFATAKVNTKIVEIIKNA